MQKSETFNLSQKTQSWLFVKKKIIKILISSHSGSDITDIALKDIGKTLKALVSLENLSLTFQ